MYNLILVSISLVSFLHKVAAGCDTLGCYQRAFSAGGYVQCDMCACDDLCDLNRDPNLYYCEVSTDNCKVTFNTTWMVIFIVLALLVLIFACYGVYAKCCKGNAQQGFSNM